MIPSQLSAKNCQSLPQYEKPFFITPNAGMAENAKICKSDEHQDEKRKRQEDYENFSSGDEAITLDVKCSSTVCIVYWSLSSKFSSVRYRIFVDLYLNNLQVDSVKQDVRSGSYQCQTVPGCEYDVEVRLVRMVDKFVRLSQSKRFKAIYSASEISELYQMSVAFAGKEAVQRFDYLYRVKPEIYFNDILYNSHGIMQKYIKDENGHRASPINGEIRGLFFSGQLYNGNFPSKSPFGDRRFVIKAHHLLSPDLVNIYFADFYCNRNPHYVTIVVCIKGSSTDNFCKKHIKPLNFYENAYLKVKAASSKNGIRYNYYVNDCVHVEICYTENVHLKDGRFENVIPIGVGSSRVGGLRNNSACNACNLRKDLNVLFVGRTMSIERPEVPNVERTPSPEPPSSQQQNGNSVSLNLKRCCAILNENTNEDESAEKRKKVELLNQPKKKSSLAKLLEQDRASRKYVNPDLEIVKLVSELVENVGVEVDLKNFTKKIRQGILDESVKRMFVGGSCVVHSLLYPNKILPIENCS